MIIFKIDYAKDVLYDKSFITYVCESCTI